MDGGIRVTPYTTACLVALALGFSAALTPTADARQASGTVTVRALSEDGPVAGAQVSAGSVGALTDERGEAALLLPAGGHTLRVEGIGLRPATVAVVVRPYADTVLIVMMQTEAVEQEEIIVTSTRSERRIEDEPLRVEVIGREEVEEKLLMTPGDIAMLLNETAGVRVQSTSPSLGGAGVRIQGLRGRYTQLLSDGLPLHGGQAAALGPLQIPPMDLGQVEVIKGAASALYGAAALGGVVNLISRRPQETSDRQMLLNQTTLGGTDAVIWASQPLGERWGYTLLAGAHRQTRADVNDDGWADLAGFGRVVLRPRLFWDNGRGGTAMLTLGGLIEDRQGGTLPGRVTPAGVAYREGLETRRVDGGTVVRWLAGDSKLLSIRGSASRQQHEHRFGARVELDTHVTGFAEVALSGAHGAHLWVAGAVLQRDRYDARSLGGFDYAFTVPAIFAQDEYAPSEWLTFSLSGRLDIHSEYGAFANPRLSVLLRPADAWTVRASGGTGYFAPTPWTEETEAVGLARVIPPVGLDVERASSASLDIARAIGSLELNATAFASSIDGAVQVRPAVGTRQLELFNAERPVRTVGTELLARYHGEGIHVTATHVYTRSTEPDPDGTGRREVPLTPRHAVGFVAAWEQEGRGRLGMEFYYTGRQMLEHNPYRSASKPYAILGFLVERRFSRARVFLNAENVLDARQTRSDPLLLPAQSPQDRWITDVWAPLEGRTFNAGVRWEF